MFVAIVLLMKLKLDCVNHLESGDVSSEGPQVGRACLLPFPAAQLAFHTWEEEHAELQYLFPLSMQE